MLKTKSATKKNKKGGPYEHILVIDAQTAVNVFGNPDLLHAHLKQRMKKLVREWNQKNAPECMAGKRVGS